VDLIWICCEYNCNVKFDSDQEDLWFAVKFCEKLYIYSVKNLWFCTKDLITDMFSSVQRLSKTPKYKQKLSLDRSKNKSCLVLQLHSHDETVTEYRDEKWQWKQLENAVHNNSKSATYNNENCNYDNCNKNSKSNVNDGRRWNRRRAVNWLRWRHYTTDHNRDRTHKSLTICFAKLISNEVNRRRGECGQSLNWVIVI